MTLLRFWLTTLMLLAGAGAGLSALPTQAPNGLPNGSAKARLQTGLGLLREGNFDQAREEFKAALSISPRLVEAHVLLGAAENQAGNYDAAVAAFLEALRLDPNSEAAHHNLALTLLRLKRTDEATKELQKVVRLNSKNASAQYNLGLLLAQKDRFKEAGEHFEAARAVEPNDPAILIRLVEAHFKARASARALELVREAIIDRSESGMIIRLGVLCLENGHFQEAVAAFQRARNSNPDSPETAPYLARAYLGANRPGDAIETLNGLPNKQSSWQISYLLGLAHVTLGQLEPAAENLREAARSKPGEPAIHYALGGLLLKSADPDQQNEGAKELNEAINLAPREPKYYMALAKWVLEQHQMETAISLLKRAINNVPPTVDIYLMMGLAEAELHGSAAAKPFVEEAVKLNPNIGLAYDLLGRLSLRVGDYENAAAYYKKAAELSPRNDLYFYEIALALERLNKTVEAVSWAEESNQLQPDRAVNHYMLGKLYAKLGRKTEAIRELETCIRLDPKLEYAYYLLARTYMQLGKPAKTQEWSRKLLQMKESKDRLVGLAPPSSEEPKILAPPSPWDSLASQGLRATTQP